MKIIKAIQNLFNSDKRASRRAYDKGYNEGLKRGVSLGEKSGYEKGWKAAMSTISKVVDDFLYKGKGNENASIHDRK